MISGDVPPLPVLIPEESVQDTPAVEEPPMKKKRVLSQKQIEALEAGRKKRREAQLAKSAAKRAEEEEARKSLEDGGVEESKGEEMPKSLKKKVSTLDEKLEALLQKERSRKSLSTDSEQEDDDEDDEDDTEDEEEEEKIPTPKTPVPKRRKTTPQLERIKEETAKYRRYLNRPEISFL
jgi:hypothetical protein